MSEFATTALSLTPINGTWPDILSRLDTYLREDHHPPFSLPKDGTLLVVDAINREILSRRPIDLQEQLEPESLDREHWRSIMVETRFSNVSDLVRFSFREDPQLQRVSVELSFATKVHESVFNYDLSRKEFRPEVKASLVQTFIALTKRLEAVGFGYRSAKEGVVLGPLSCETLCDYVESGSRWFSNRHKYELKVAAVQSSCVKDGAFEVHHAKNPMYYRQSGFYLWDILWPS